MKHVKGTLAGLVAVATLSAGTAVYADTTLNTYTWRPQDEALWDYINEHNLIDGVTIRLDTTTEDFESKLRVDMQTNRPDIFFAKAGAPWLSPWIDAGVIAPVTDYDVDLSMYGDAALGGSTGADGALYSVPVGMEMQAILYNKATFEQHGVDEPQTLRELEAAFETFADNGTVPMHVGARAGWWVNQVFNEVLIAGFAGDDWARDVITGDACFTDEAYVDTLRVVERWRDNGWLNPNPLADDYGAMRTDVALGTSAMMIDGIWSAGPASPMFDIEPDLEIGIMPLPEGRVYGFPDFGLAANPNSEHQEAIEKVLQFVTTEEFAQLYAEHVGLPAANHEVDVDDERIATAARMIAENNVAANPFFSYALNADEPSYAQLAADEVSRLVAGRASAEETAQAIQDGLNGWGYVGADRCS